MNLITILKSSNAEYKSDSKISKKIISEIVNDKNFNEIMEALSDK